MRNIFKKRSTSLTSRKMKIRTTLRVYLTPIRITKFNKWNPNKQKLKMTTNSRGRNKKHLFHACGNPS